MVVECKKYKVLLIEDNKLDRMAFERFVHDQNLQYDYTAVQSISQAKEILESERFDIIVSDYSLGDGTALDILNSVKDIPIILITAAEDEEVPVNARRAGSYDYLPKDFDRNYLKAVPETIENAIKHKKVEQAIDKEQKNLDAIFRAAPAGMLLADENMIIARANYKAKRMLHREYSQLVNHPVCHAMGCIKGTDIEKGFGCKPACSDCSLKNAIRDVLGSGQSVQGVEINPTIQTKNGRIKPWFRISIEPVIIDGCTCLIIEINDITRQKKPRPNIGS
jgi:DNA-binding response OmpR family regulator